MTQNFFHDNTVPFLREDAEPGLELFQAMGEDVFIEVSHGPTLLDNNIFLSARAVKLDTQGVAFVHNLIGGSLTTGKMICTETLGMAFEPEQYFENPDGTLITFNEDYFGSFRNKIPTVGPLEKSNVKKSEIILAKDIF